MSGQVCDFCKSSENSGSLLPLVSDSIFFGPSFDEIIIYLISFLPKPWLDKIGFYHDASKKGDKTEKKVKSPMDLNRWLKSEYLGLAIEVSQRGCSIDETSERIDSHMLESRKFVLNRLAELMEKKSEIEKSLLKQSSNHKQK